MRYGPYGRLLEKIDRFIDLPASATSRASRLGEEISREASEIKLKSNVGEELNPVIARFDSLSSRLSRSVSNSKRGVFRRDWDRFARSETTRLKDEALALQEVLNEVNEDVREDEK